MYTILCKHISKVKVYLNNSEKEKNLDCRYNTLQQGYSTILGWGPDCETEIVKGAIHFDYRFLIKAITVRINIVRKTIEIDTVPTPRN